MASEEFQQVLYRFYSELQDQQPGSTPSFPHAVLLVGLAPIASTPRAE
ncbi:hypothetical protein GFS31_25000 [Leptolyngbya sp. BL0902]|nr:hypothetical protein GFS31_25000 [Leptolyngbya sp. BL0902]